MWWGRGGDNVPRRKVFLSDAQGLVPSTWWPHKEVGHNAEANAEQRRLFPGERPFATPKPERLMARIVEISTAPGDLVLDPFLGSGTTAAVADELGRTVGGHRVVGSDDRALRGAPAQAQYGVGAERASRARTRGESRMIPRRRRPAIIDSCSPSSTSVA